MVRYFVFGKFFEDEGFGTAQSHFLYNAQVDGMKHICLGR